MPVSAQVFIAEALGNLVVAVIAGHHQQLLEQLRTLRQREEVTGVDTAGHQVITCAFGRGLAQHRRFDVDEAMGVEELARFHRHAVAQHQVFLHVRAAQIQHAVRQSCGLAQAFFVELEWGCNRRVEHRQFVAQHLHLAAFEAVVDGAVRARTHQTLDLNAELVAQALGGGKHGGTVRITDHLHITFTIANINKNHAAVVTPTVDPAAKTDGLTQEGFGHKTAIVGTHSHKQLSKPSQIGGTG